MLCDTTRSLGLAYGACDDAQAGYAKRISVLIGPDGLVLKVYPKVNPGTHADEVLADV